MKARLPIVVLLTGMLTAPAVAHDDGVYESLGHIPVGRIFLSPEERMRLDKVRGKAPAQSARTQPTGKASSRVFDKDAAGFIVSDSGKTRVWKNGEFVTTTSTSNVRFPGQVRVASQDQAPESADAGKKDKTEEATVEAGDEKD